MKELQELEMNGLVSREVCNTKPVSVQYELTHYNNSGNDVLKAMERWGFNHRQKIVTGT